MDLTYYAEGAARTSSTGAEQSYGVRDWKFDGMHPADFANADSKYGNLVDENYRYDEAWLKSLIEPGRLYRIPAAGLGGVSPT